MAKYRKKPVVIDAEQWEPGKKIAGVVEGAPGVAPFIETLEGPLTVSPGDWIITGVKGERYPCKPEVFALTYEPADDPTTNPKPVSTGG